MTKAGSPELPESWQELRQAALEVRGNAYAPYSKFPVGAALRATSGQIFTGCNVENASFGGTICAERTAVCSAVAAGEKSFEAICISLTGTPVPCGICRQFLYEFNPNLLVLLDDTDLPDQPPECVLLSDLLPRGFRLETTD